MKVDVHDTCFRHHYIRPPGSASPPRSLWFSFRIFAPRDPGKGHRRSWIRTRLRCSVVMLGGFERSCVKSVLLCINFRLTRGLCVSEVRASCVFCSVRCSAMIPAIHMMRFPVACRSVIVHLRSVLSSHRIAGTGNVCSRGASIKILLEDEEEFQPVILARFRVLCVYVDDGYDDLVILGDRDRNPTVHIGRVSRSVLWVPARGLNVACHRQPFSIIVIVIVTTSITDVINTVTIVIVVIISSSSSSAETAAAFGS